MQRLRRFLLKDDFDKGIKRPGDYSYLRLLRFNLIVLNSWPSKEIGEQASKYRVVMTYANILLQLYYFYASCFRLWETIRIQTFFELGHTYIMLFMTFVSLTRIFMISLSSKCREVVVTYLTKMHLFYFKDVSEYAKKTHKRIHFICHMYTLWLLWQMAGDIFMLNFLPVFNNFSAGKFKVTHLYNTTYQNSMYINLPFDTSTDFYGYLVMSLINGFDSYISSILVYLLDLLLSLIVFHLWGHYQILLHDLASFPLPAKKRTISIYNNNDTVNAVMYSKEELKDVSKKLKECIEYHRLITNFNYSISDAFGPMLLITYGFHQAIECILLLECSQLTVQAFMGYGTITIILFQQLIQISVIFELIGSVVTLRNLLKYYENEIDITSVSSVSEKLKDAVYGVPWEYMDVENRKMVIVFMINVQEPIHVKALGIARIGVTTMATIIRTSFSYFLFLRSL